MRALYMGGFGSLSCFERGGGRKEGRRGGVDGRRSWEYKHGSAWGLIPLLLGTIHEGTLVLSKKEKPLVLRGGAGSYCI